MNPLLILVDLQTVFLDSPGLEPSRAKVVERVEVVLQACREKQIPIVHLRTGTPPGRRQPRLKTGRLSKPEINSKEYQPPAILAAEPAECIAHKIGYSGFQDAAIQELIQRCRIDTLWVTGLFTHACVRQAALDGLEAGLRVIVVEDGVASDEPFHAEVTRRFLQQREVRFVNACEIIDGNVTEQFADAEDNASRAPMTGQTPQSMSQAWEVESRRGSTDAESSEAPMSRGKIEDVDSLVALAKRVAPTWNRTKWEERLAFIKLLDDQIELAFESLAAEITSEIGKPLFFSEAEITSTREMLGAILRRFSDPQELETRESDGVLSRRRPHGVVAVVTPYNNPLYLPLGKIIPAALLGNSVVWKPAHESVKVARRVMKCLQKAKWPEGLVNLLEGDGGIGQKLLHHPSVDAITITGSSATGRSAALAAAERQVPLQAELGGNNAAIVWEDADIPEAAERICAGAFEMAGQRCTANRRVIVHHNIREEFLGSLVAATRDLKGGNPEERDCRIGLLCSERLRDTIAATVTRAMQSATCIQPREDLTTDHVLGNRYFPPTIICCDDPEQDIVQQETFGQVLVLQSAESWQQALELCNGVRQGLAAAIFTKSSQLTRQFLDEAEAGILKVNQSTSSAAIDVPFGGWKASGIGPPEHGAYDLEFFTRQQTVYEHHDEIL